MIGPCTATAHVIRPTESTSPFDLIALDLVSYGAKTCVVDVLALAADSSTTGMTSADVSGAFGTLGAGSRFAQVANHIQVSSRC